MRVGESLRETDDAEYFSVISEQDPDFSSRVCKGLTMSDFVEVFDSILTQKQVRNLIEGLCKTP